MVDLPTFSDASDTAEDTIERTKSHARTLLPWLSDPPSCDDCGSLLYASQCFDWREGMRVKSWECRECDARDRYRVPEYGSQFVDE